MTPDECQLCSTRRNVRLGVCPDCAALLLFWINLPEPERTPPIPDHRLTHAERQRILADQMWVIAQIYTGHTPSPAAAELAHLDVDLNNAEWQLEIERGTDPIRFYYDWPTKQPEPHND